MYSVIGFPTAINIFKGRFLQDNSYVLNFRICDKQTIHPPFSSCFSVYLLCFPAFYCIWAKPEWQSV